MLNNRKKPVLVGLSGGLDSLVAAYLLKIQKVDIFALLIAPTPEEYQENGDQLFSCHQSEARIDALKKFCDHLQVPLTVVRPREEFQSCVVDSWLSSKVDLRKSRACLDCHQFRLRILYQKMNELGCEGLATGHFAKLVRHSHDASVSVHSSNDMDCDQSHLLMATPQNILDQMILPLSDLQKKEVIKIASNFALMPPERILKFDQCLPHNPVTDAFAEKMIAKSLRGEGEVMLGEHSIGSHKGFHTLSYAEPFTQISQGRAGDEAPVIVDFDWSQDMITLGAKDYFQDSGVFLTNCHWGSDIDQIKPMKGFLHRGGGLLDIEVLVCPKALGAAWVTLMEGKTEFKLGEELIVFKKRGKNAKAIVSGTMKKLARLVPDNNFPIEVRGENGQETHFVDKDFNF
jgi:tRNA-uridine 2-sulfurtransferase